MLQPAPIGGEVGGEEGISAEQFVWLLGGLARFYRLPFDAALLLQQFPPPYAPHTLLEAARALGFKAGQSTIHEGKLSDVPLPAIGFLRIQGPFNAQRPDDSRSRRRILTCHPAETNIQPIPARTEGELRRKVGAQL